MKFGDRVLLKQYKNGNKLWGTVTRCYKCQGTGKVIWDYANHVCFDCNGDGWYYSKEREFTPENLAKYEAKLSKKREQWEREEAEREAKRQEEETRREAERQAWIEANRGQFVGEIGQKIEVEVTLERRFDYERPCFNAPWATEVVTGYVFKTDDGNTLVWKTTGSLGYTEEVANYDDCDFTKGGKYCRFVAPAEGDRIKIKGTIKAHEEYRDVNQTILNRVKWVK